MREFGAGLRDGIPIALGYFTVCIAFGLQVVTAGMPPWVIGVQSATNLSSSGQFAGIAVIIAGGSALQLALTVAVVNLRYVLMSLSLSQKLEPGITWWQRMLVAYGVTDEIFALAMRRDRVPWTYYVGLTLVPIVGWTSGGLVGAIAGTMLPPSIQAAMGVLLYAMFVAVVVPPAKGSRSIMAVVGVAAVTSTLLAFLPVVNTIEVGWRIIIATLIAAAFGATVFPVPAEQEAA